MTWLPLGLVGMLLVLCASAAAVDFHVKRFGAAGDGTTDDGPAFRDALAAAAASGGSARVVCDDTTYRIGFRGDDFFALTLDGAQDVTVDGQGALLVFDPRNMALMLGHCQRVTISDLRIDFDPLPYTQGVITGVDQAAGAFTVGIEEGYPLPPTGDAFQSVYRHGCFLDPDRRWYTWNWCYIAAVRPVESQARTYRITATPAMADAIEKVEPGQRFVFRNPPWAAGDVMRSPLAKVGRDAADRGAFHNPPIAAVQVRYCDDCTLDGIDQYMSPNMSVFVDGSTNTMIRRYRVLYKPGTDRLAAGLSDGIHCKGNETGPVIEDCYFEGLWDDAINLGSPGDVVAELVSYTEVLTRVLDLPWIDSYLEAGDRVVLFDPVEGEIIGERRVVSSKFAGNQRRVVTLDKPFASVRDERTDPKGATILYADRGPSAVRGCTFHNSMKTATLPNSGTVFEDNTVEDCAYGVHGFLCGGLGAQTFPHNLTIRDNIFRHVWIGAVVLFAGTENPAAEPLPGNIVIEGNTIEQDLGSGITLTNLSGVTLRRNTVIMDPATPAEWQALQLDHCGATTIADSHITDPRPAVRAAIDASTTPRAAVSLDNVAIDVASGVAETRFRDDTFEDSGQARRPLA